LGANQEFKGMLNSHSLLSPVEKRPSVPGGFADEISNGEVDPIVWTKKRRI